MNALLDITSIVDKLKTECPLFCERVYQSINGDVDLAGHAAPLALVYEDGDDSTENAVMTALSQKHHYLFAVKIAVRKTASQTDRLGFADAQALRACRQQVIDAIVGFIPNEWTFEINHANGKPSSDSDMHYWTYTFLTADYLRS